MYSSFGGQALEVADAIVIGIEEGFDVDLIDDRILVPKRIIGIDAGQRRALWNRDLDVVHLRHIMNSSQSPVRCVRAGAD